MRRVLVFGALVVASIIGLVLLTAWYLGSYQHGGSFTGVMGQMMGSNSAALSPMPGGVWASLVVLLIVISVGVVGAAYYAAYPEIRTGTGVTREEPMDAGAKQDHEMNWSVLVRTSKPEEKKVLEVLAAHNGRYLQKFIVKESGLSKLKTHRILSRFVERGIVAADKSGNTNEIALAPWLHPETSADAFQARPSPFHS